MSSRIPLLRATAERTLTWLLVAALGLLLTIIGAQLFKPDYRATLSPQTMTPELGHAFVARLPRPSLLYRLRSDAADAYRPSKLILEENGKQLGPARSVHATIRATGQGAYSHWHDYLYFSTSDNSDPRENGRIYSVRAPLFISGALTALLLSSLAASFLAFHVLWLAKSRHPVPASVRRALKHPLGRRLATHFQLSERQRHVLARRTYVLVVAAAIVWINWVFLGATEIRTCLSPDSGSYLSFSLIRPSLYPALVQLTHHMTGDIRWLVPLQLNAIMLSLAVLGAAVGRLSNSHAWGLAFTLLSLTLTPLLLLSSSILTEALFAAFITLHVAMAGLFIKTRSWRHAVLAGVFLAALILTRPAGYSLLLALPLLVWLLRGEPKKVLIGVGAPILVSFTMVSTFNFVKFGVFNAQSYGGMTLLGHVTYLIRPGDGAYAGVHARTVERIATKIEPIATSLRGQTFPHELWHQTSQRYNELLYTHALAVIFEDLKRQDPRLQGVEEMEKAIEASMAIALSVIRAHPFEYARHVLANYYGVWQGFLVDYGPIPAHASMCYTNMKTMHPRMRKIFKRVTDLTYLDDAAAGRRFEQRSNTKTVLRYIWTTLIVHRHKLLAIALFLSIAFIFLSFRAQKNPLTLLLSYASFQLNAYIAYLATITAAIERYSVPFTPVLFLILFGTLIVCSPIVTRLIRRGKGSSRDALSF